MSGMAFDSDASAAEALAAANNGDVAPVVAAPEQAPVVDAAPNTVDAGPTSSESSTFDINAVPEALRPQVQELMDGSMRQADYTRKTQEIAPVRQLMEQTGMSVEEAQQALTFVQNLNDPAQLQALYTQLHEQFAAETEGEGEEVDPRDTELKSLSTRLERFEKAQAETQAATQVNTAVAAVKESHPDFKEADMQRVQQIAVSHMQGGTRDVAQALTNAAKEYADWRTTTITEYINAKGQVSANGVPALGQTTHAETPAAPFPNLDEATKAALQRFGNSI